MIAADKAADHGGEHGCCLRHWHSFFQLPQVNQKLMKYFLSSLWWPNTELAPHETAPGSEALHTWHTFSPLVQIL